MKITVWHCYDYGKYDYGKNDTYVLVAGSEEELKSKARESIAALWEEDDHGPMPDDFDALMEVYRDYFGDYYYFGDWGYTEIEVQP